MKLTLTAVLAATAMALAPAANATPATGPTICNILDGNPDAVGVTIVSMALLNAGIDAESIARIIINAVDTTCPEHYATLQDFVDYNQRNGA